MKTMTCNQLGGACDKEFHDETFDGMAAQAQQHGKEMMEASDADHMAAMGKMSEMMKDPTAMKQWMDDKRAEFDQLTEN